MVGPGGLEVHVVVRPPHRPVDLPDQLALRLGGQVGHAGEGAHVARVGEVGRLLVVRREGDGVAAAVAAEGLEGEAGQLARAGLLVGGDRVGEGRSLLRLQLAAGLGVRHRLLGAVASEHGVDLVAGPHGEQHLVAVGAGAVELGLGDLLHLDAEVGQRLLERSLEVGRPRVVAVPGVGHRGQRPADVRRPLGGHSRGHLAEAVVVVPHVQVAHLEPASAELVGDEVGGQELAQVAQVHRAGGGRARRDGHRLALAGVAYGVVRRTRHPVDGSALLSTSCHGAQANGARDGAGAIPRGDSGAVLRSEHAPAAHPRGGRRTSMGWPVAATGIVSADGTKLPPWRAIPPRSSRRWASTAPPNGSTSGSSPCRGTRSWGSPGSCRSGPSSCCATWPRCASVAWWSWPRTDWWSRPSRMRCPTGAAGVAPGVVGGRRAR